MHAYILRLINQNKNYLVYMNMYIFLKVEYLNKKIIKNIIFQLLLSLLLKQPGVLFHCDDLK